MIADDSPESDDDVEESDDAGLEDDEFEGSATAVGENPMHPTASIAINTSMANTTWIVRRIIHIWGVVADDSTTLSVRIACC